MADAPSQQPAQPPAPAIVADVMRPPLTTADQDDHVAAAAYLMQHAGASALMVLDAHTGQRHSPQSDQHAEHGTMYAGRSPAAGHVLRRGV